MRALVGLLLLVLLASCLAPLPLQEPPVPAVAGRCDYPRLHAVFSNADRQISTDPARITRLAPFDSVELDVDAGSWRLPATLRSQHEGVRLWAYVPGQFYWDDWSGGCADHPLRCLLVRMVQPGWPARNTKGEVIYDSYGEPKTHPKGGYYAAAAMVLGDGLSAFDGVRWDVVNGRVRLPELDLDLDGVADLGQYGQDWIDVQYRDGIAPALEQLPYDHIGNGSWEPSLTTGEPQYQGIMGYMVEYYTYHDGSRWIRPGLAWWVRYYLAHPQAEWIFLQDAQGTYHWADLRRSLALALLGDGYAGVGNPVWPGWCDECGVVSGYTSRQAAAGDWLGCAWGNAVEVAPAVWRRDFDGGVAFLNTGYQAYQADDVGLRAIAGWYDQAVNNGRPWDGKVPAQDGRILWREAIVPPTATPAATLTPTAEPTPSPTIATSTATPTPTPASHETPPAATATPNLQATVEAIIEQLDAVRDAWSR